MLILGLESSADDSCAAVVSDDRQILSNVVIKQNKVHEEHGGIHPYFAIEAHQANMPYAVQRALKEANISANDVHGIAFTRGPGIGGCLSVGSNAAKSLAAALNKPLVGVHHMQAHALTPLLSLRPPNVPKFPFLTLLVSGGHTLLLLAQSPTKFNTLATTVDESIGRAYDKVSRLLELKWGEKGLGAALEQFCDQSPDGTSSASLQSQESGSQPEPNWPKMPNPTPRRLSFSYACLHSAVERHIHSQGGISNMPVDDRRDLARAFQTAASVQLEEKVMLALQWCQKEGITIQDLVVSGGVASNMFLRSRLQNCLEQFSPGQIGLRCPPPSLCTDNAAMIAWAAMPRFLAGDHDEYSIHLRPKWDIQELGS